MTNPQPTQYSMVKVESLPAQFRKKARLPIVARKGNKRYPDWKGRGKLSLFADDSVQITLSPHKKLLELAAFSKMAGYTGIFYVSLY